MKEMLPTNSDPANGRDTVKPKIEDIGFCRSGSQKYDTSVNFTKFGNFANDNTELVITAKDYSETTFVSGIGDVFLYDNKNSAFEPISARSAKTDQYIFTIPVGTKIDDMYISVSDK